MELQRRFTVDPGVEQVGDPGMSQDGSAVAAARHHGGLQPGPAQLPDPRNRSGKHLDSGALQLILDQQLLSVADPPHGLLLRWGVRPALGQLDPARGQKVTYAVLARLAVQIGCVVAALVKGGAGAAALSVPGAQELIKRALPRRGMHGACSGQHPVEVEQHRIEVLGGDPALQRDRPARD